MSATDQTALVNFINSGKGVYWEGTNIASDHNSTELWNLFGASYTGTGPDTGDVMSLTGNANTFADGMEFNYSPYGEYPNARVNRISATDGIALLDSDNGFSRVVYNDTGAGKVIASTIIFGALYNQDVVSTRANLMASYLSFILDKEEPTLWASDSAIDFGTLLPENGQTINLYIRNLGLDVLEISDILIDGNDFTYDGASNYDLPFGQIADIPIYFPCTTEGEFSSQLTINSNDPVNPTRIFDISGSCYSVAQIQVDPQNLAFEVGIGSSVESEFTITNTGGGYLDYFIETLAMETHGRGGPDAYGYTWIDSNDPDGPQYEWFDISSLGIDGELSGVDNYIIADIPIPFPFYGEIRDQVKISTNGYITFGNDPVDHSNDQIPFSMDPDDFIAPLWDDLRTVDESVLYTYFDVESDRFIIQYQDWKFYTGGGSGDLDFQIQLYPNGDIYFLYENLEGTLTSSTVGIENFDSSIGLQVAYNEVYLENNLAVKISPNPSWLRLDKYSGSVFQDLPQIINVDVNTSSLTIGSYMALIKIHNSDTENPLIEIPVTLNVTATGVEDDIPVTPMLSQNYPNPFNPITHIDFFVTDEDSETKITIFNMKGQVVKNIADKQFNPGKHSVIWDGNDDSGNAVGSGLYFYRLTSNNYSQTRKMILMK